MNDGAFDMSGSQHDPLAGAGASVRASGAGKSVYKAQMTRANIVLAGLFIAGGITVYVLSLHKGPAQASADEKLIETNVDSAILRLNSSPVVGPEARSAANLTRGLLKSFSEQIIDSQVPLSKLPKDPFVFVRPASSIAEDPIPDSKPKKPTKTPEEITYAEAMEKLKKLTLQSVMMGSGQYRVAIISNNLLTVGQKIDGFTVKRIDSEEVVLTWKGSDYSLEMEDSGE